MYIFSPLSSTLVKSKENIFTLAIASFSSATYPDSSIISILSLKGSGIVSITLAVQTNNTFIIKALYYRSPKKKRNSNFILFTLDKSTGTSK